MGGCLSRTSFTVNKGRLAALRCIQPFLFSTADAESVLQESDMGDYLMYRDHDSDRIVLSVRYNSYIHHRRITELNNLYYLDNQPYPYLDSIILYHRQHKLNGMKLNKQAHLSARVVRIFAHKVTNKNGNHTNTHANGRLTQENGDVTHGHERPQQHNGNGSAMHGDETSLLGNGNVIYGNDNSHRGNANHNSYQANGNANFANASGQQNIYSDALQNNESNANNNHRRNDLNALQNDLNALQIDLNAYQNNLNAPHANAHYLNVNANNVQPTSPAYDIMGRRARNNSHEPVTSITTSSDSNILQSQRL